VVEAVTAELSALVPLVAAQQKPVEQDSAVPLAQDVVKAVVWRNLSAERKLLAETVATPMVMRRALNILVIVRIFLIYLLLTSFARKNLNFISRSQPIK
jgi:hypothetical protein